MDASLPFSIVASAGDSSVDTDDAGGRGNTEEEEESFSSSIGRGDDYEVEED